MKRSTRKSMSLPMLAVFLVSAAGVAHAQLLGDVKTLQSTEEEAELPDIDAIEKGARPPASVSFRRPSATSLQPPPSGEKPADAKRPGDATTVTRIEGAASGLQPPGGFYGVDSSYAETPSDEVHAVSVPELHVVKNGDTLWSICTHYFRDPWQWPKLWAENPLVTNPHWIFPGDVLRLRVPGTSAAPPLGGAVASGGPTITSNRSGSLTSTALVLREVGFVESKDFAERATITGSREEKLMLATGDQAYLTFSKDNPLKAGERYTVFLADRDTPVTDPESGKTLGYLVRIYGDLVVDQIAERNTARGTLLDLVDVVERGYSVSPMIRQFKRIEPRPSAVNLEARIVAAFLPAKMLGPEAFVVLSRGRKDGLAVGNRTFVVRRGDGRRRLMEGWERADPNFPKEVVGELWIVDVRDGASVAWVARSSKEIRVGEMVEMRKGH